jgi:hypothetical protein
MLDIVARRPGDLNASEKLALMRVMSEAFTLTVPVEQAVNHYCSRIANVLLAYSGLDLVGFQFFQECTVDGVHVSHFSVAAKSEAYRDKGLQRAFGGWLIRRAMRRMINPLRPIAIAGVSNNPKTYRNMLLIGGRVFPDVTRPTQAFTDRDLYASVARRLDIQGLDLATGLIRNRASSLGVHVKTTAFEERSDAIHEGFMRYIDRDVNHGVFTLAVSTPLAAVASFATRQLGLRKSSGNSWRQQ